MAQRGKGRDTRVGHFCRIKSHGLEKCSLQQVPKWIWTEQGCWRKGVALVVSHIHEGAWLGVASPEALVICAVPVSEAPGTRGRGSHPMLCVTLRDALDARGNPSLTYSRDADRTATEGGKGWDVGSCPSGFCVDYQGQRWHPAFLLKSHQQPHFLLFADTTVIFTASCCSYTKRGLWVQVQRKKIATAGVDELLGERRCYFSCKCCY